MAMTDSFSDSPFQYEPLPQSTAVIRLLAIEPGRGSIQCSMKLAPIEGGTYSCLSYSWDDSMRLNCIYINSRPFLVRKNLYDFLLAARRYRFKEAIWIDAVCINQENLSEKNSQVQLMGKIYYTAIRVVVWLGSALTDEKLNNLSQILHVIEARDPRCWCTSTVYRGYGIRFGIREYLRPKLTHCQCSFRLIEQSVPQLLENHGWRFLSTTERCHLLLHPREVLETRMGPVPPLTQAEVETWGSFLNRLDLTWILMALASASYWARVWIVQEVVLARRAVVLAPTAVLELQTVLDLIVSGLDGIVAQKAPLGLSLDSHGKLRKERQQLRKYLVTLRTYTRICSFGQFHHGGLLFHDSLKLTKGRLCYDHRDRVYSVISLTKNGDSFEIDYTVSDLELYSRCLQHEARDSPCIRVLGLDFVFIVGATIAASACRALYIEPPRDTEIIELYKFLETHSNLLAESAYISFWVSIELAEDIPGETSFALCTTFCQRGRQWLLVFAWDPLEKLDLYDVGVWRLVEHKWKRMCNLRKSPHGGFGKCHAHCKCGPLAEYLKE